MSGRAAALALSTTLGVAFAALIQLPPDVTYYLAWSRQPALAYLDHPPLVALPFFPLPDRALLPAARLLPIIAAAGHLLLIERLLHAARPSAPRAAAVAALVTTPLWLGALTLWTPDIPLLLCWHAALLLTITPEVGRSRWLLPPLAALATASKITALPLFGALALVSWRSTRLRAPLAWALLAALAALLLTGLPSLSFQLSRFSGGHLHGGLSLRPGGPFELIGAQLALAGPVLGLLILSALRRGSEPEPTAARLRALVLLIALPLLGVTLLMHVEPNWMAPALVPALLRVHARGVAPRWLVTSAAVGAALIAFTGIQLALRPLDLGASDPLRRLRGWERWAEAFPEADLVLGDRYQRSIPIGTRRATPAATFDALGDGLAIRPSALDARAPMRQAETILLVWSEREPPEAPLIEAGFTRVIGAGVVEAPPWAGPEARTWWTLRGR